MSDRPRILIISLDGATFDVLCPMINQGWMPVLGALMSGSVCARLESTIQPITAPAWTSFMTGKNPGKHGVFDFRLYNPHDDRDFLVNARHIRGKTIWQMLSEHSRRICVVNLPLTYPPTPVNGYLVSGFDIPSTAVSFTYPGSLRDEILTLVPNYTSTAAVWGDHPINSAREKNEFTDSVIRGFEQTTQVALYCMGGIEWDVAMVHYQDTDLLQHHLWDHIVEACEDPRAEGLAARIRECFRRLDRCLGTLLNTIDPEHTVTLLMSDHGFGAHHGVIYPNALLRQWGYLATVTRQERWRMPRRLLARVRGSRYGWVRETYQCAAEWKHWLRRRLTGPSSSRTTELEKLPWEHFAAPKGSLAEKLLIDWSRTRAVMAMGSHAAFVYVNLVGRNAHGIVQPGKEYERLVSELTARFTAAVHPARPEARLFARVARGADVYRAGEDAVLPDLVLVPTESWSVSRVIAATPTGGRTTEGMHRPEGILLVQGPKINPRARLEAPQIVDLAPTLLHLLGLPVPGDIDGRVLDELFSSRQQIVYGGHSHEPFNGNGTTYSEGEASVVEERLRGLGYL